MPRPKKPAARLVPAPLAPPRCDGCGAIPANLLRAPVEGVVCERCPDCVRDGVVP